MAAAAALAAALAVATADYHLNYQTEQWRSAAAFVEGNARATDLIVVSTAFSEHTFAYYRSGRHIDEVTPGRDFHAPFVYLGTVRSETARHPRVFVTAPSHAPDPDGRVRASIEQSHRFHSERDFHSVRVLLFE